MLEGMSGEAGEEQEEQKVSVQLEEWLHSDRKKTIGDLVETFGPRSFAILFVVLMALPALPLPTGAVSHVLEILTMLLALELVVGRTEVWIPDRFRDRELKGLSGPKFSRALLKRIRWIEKLRASALEWPWWRSENEKNHVLAQFDEAKAVYEKLAR